MGIYLETRYEGQDDTLLVRTGTPGLETVSVYQLVATIENRTNCYCCSCPDEGPTDMACRNHGFAASRPCEYHNMPGQTWGEEMMGTTSYGTMPLSVQAVRAQRAERKDN